MDEKLLFNQNYALPRIFKPAKWENIDFGGYFLKPTSLVKTSFTLQQKALKKCNLSKVYDILNFI